MVVVVVVVVVVVITCMPVCNAPPFTSSLYNRHADVLKTDMAAANVLLRDATSRARSVQRDSRVLLSLYVPNDHLFALYAP